MEDLDKIRPRTPEAEKLTWRDIVGNDEADADALWGQLDEDENVDLSERGYSGDAEASISDGTDPTSTSAISGVDDEGLKLYSLLLEPDSSYLDDLKQAQTWRSAGDDGYARPLTEDKAVREILHMLLGLPSSLFIHDQETGTFRSSPNYYVESLSSSGFEQLLDSFASIGVILQRLRQRMLQKQDSALQQTFAQCIEQELKVFSETLTIVENTISKPCGPIPVSLFDLHGQVETAAYALTSLASISESVSQHQHQHDDQILDNLYTQICEAQAIGNDQGFATLQKTFAYCLQTYLRPTRAWITTGTLNDDVSFIRQREKAVDVSTFWGQQYSVHTRDRRPVAPEIMQIFVSMIFSLGKQVAFMDALGVGFEGLDEERKAQSEEDMLESLSSADLADLIPYSTIVSRVLHSWIQKHRQHSSNTLSNHMLHTCGLFRALDTLAHIYLSANGSLFQNFAESVFARLDAGKSTWSGPLTLETLAREAFAAVIGSEARKLSAQSHQSTLGQKLEGESRTAPTSVRALTSINLTLAISPALQNIIHPHQIQIYQSASHLLLQLYRSISLLASLDITSLQQASVSLPLRQRLLHLITTIRSHVLHAGIAAASTVLREQINRAWGVDEMIGAHAAFVAKLEQCCFLDPDAALTNVRRLVVNLCDIAVNFAKLWQPRCQQNRDGRVPGSISDSSGDEEDVASISGPGAAGGEEVGPVRLRQMLKQVDHLQMLLISALRSAGRTETGDSHGRACDAEARQDFGMLAEELDSSLGPRRRRTSLEG